MNRLHIFILGLFTGYSVTGQNSLIRPLASFNAVKVSEGIEVHLEKGEEETASLEVWGTDAENIRTELHGEMLKIYLNSGSYPGAKIVVHLSYKVLGGVFAGSGAKVYARQPVQASKLYIRAGSGAAVMLPVEAERVEVQASTTATVKLEGRVRQLVAFVSSSGTLQALDLQADEVKIQAETDGSARVYVLNELEATATTTGNIRYKGNPSRSVIQSFTAGTVRKLD
ncbi:MAG: DUF2807 domain-containing protein [Cyclobacteriaceae bacterium]|nr:MAG: DUF2807 domain-containing protein [Cyclobacteriaceae bacterium]